jgi:hypothetical protein
LSDKVLNQNFDVIIVSSFGRHNWLAKELALNEWRVGHIDCSKILGEWREEDLRNPFGLSATPDLKTEQAEYWKSNFRAQHVEKGLSILFARGPFEGSGPMQKFFRSKQNISKQLVQYLEPQSHQSNEKRKNLHAKSFDETWLLNLSQQMSATVYLDNAQANRLDESYPIFSDLYKDLSSSECRRSAHFLKNLPSAANFEASHLVSVEKASDHSFELTATASRTDSQESKSSKGIGHQVLRARVLLWGLGSAETEFLSPQARKFLFPTRILEASWSWQRFAFKGPSDILELWPEQFFMIDHLRLPWTHDNLGLVSKTDAVNFDIWMRVPTIFRFNAKYTGELGALFARKLCDRLMTDDFEMLELPTDSRLKKEQIGPPRWPIFSFEDVSSFKNLKKKYLIFDSVDQHRTHQIQAQLKIQDDLFQELTQMRREWLTIESKAQQKFINNEIRMKE